MTWDDALKYRETFYGEMALASSGLLKELLPHDEWEAHVTAAKKALAEFDTLMREELWAMERMLAEVRQ